MDEFQNAFVRELREHYAALVNQGQEVIQEGTTSGSTGVAVRIKLSPEHQAWNFASQWLGRSWYGVSIGDPGVWIWGRPIYSWRKRALVTAMTRGRMPFLPEKRIEVSAAR